MSLTTPTLSRSQGRVDPRAQALHQLKVALAVELPENEQDWAYEVEHALSLIEKALKEYRTAANAPDSVLAEVDETRETLARQADGIRQERASLLQECVALQLDLQTAAHALPVDTETPSPLPTPATPAADSVDFHALRLRLEEFRARVEGILQTETELVRESITTDLGAGD